MEIREDIIKQWFHMWLQKRDSGIRDIFTEGAFDGMSLIQWTEDNRICFLKEFGCNENRYDPYQDGAKPKFRDEKAKWF